MHKYFGVWKNNPWLWQVLVFAGLYLGVLNALSLEFWDKPFLFVQNDGRHFVVWLRQLHHPELFQNDPIAQHWLALTPKIYQALYLPAGLLGIDVVTWQYLFVTPLACLLLVASVHRFTLFVLPGSLQAAIAMLLLCFAFSDFLVVGLPRSFGYPIVFFALTAFLQDKKWLLAVSLFLGALMYPTAAIVTASTITLLVIIRWSRYRHVPRKEVESLCVAVFSSLAGLLIFMTGADAAGPTVTLSHAKTLPIFGQGGRTSFFSHSLVHQVLSAGRGGLLPFSFKGRPWLSLAVTVLLLVFGARCCARLIQALPAERRERLKTLMVALVVTGLVLF